MQQQLAVREYIESILTYHNIDPQTAEGQELAGFLYHELDRFTKESIINAIPTNKLDDLAQLLSQNPTSETIHRFAQEHIPNLDEIFMHTFQQFMDFYTKSEVSYERT